MADINVTLNTDLLPNLLSDGGEEMKNLPGSVLNQVLESRMAEHLGADRHEWSSDRTGDRNGYRERQLATRVGTLILRGPQTRNGNCSTDLFRRTRRSEQALVLALMEMVVRGGSTRKLTHITEELCGAQSSKVPVSSLATGLSARVNHWRTRRLNGPYPSLPFIGALLAEFHEQWRTGKKYFDRTEYQEWRKQEPLKIPSLLSVVE